jgi:hypothetical protein
MPHTTPTMRQEMLRLARTLLQQTKEGKIKWTVTDEENEFVFSSTKSAVLIRGSFGNYDEEDEGDFVLELLNRGGSVAARLETGFAEEEIPGEAEYYHIVKELYLEVQNRTLEISATLEDMHRALGMETDSDAASSDAESQTP